MATYSSVLSWRILGTREPGGLPCMGLYRVRQDWSDLAAAASLYLRSWHSILYIVDAWYITVTWVLSESWAPWQGPLRIMRKYVNSMRNRRKWLYPLSMSNSKFHPWATRINQGFYSVSRYITVCMQLSFVNSHKEVKRVIMTFVLVQWFDMQI